MLTVKTSTLSSPSRSAFTGTVLNSPGKLEEFARESGWIKAKPRKLTPVAFVKGILLAVSGGDRSFRGLASSVGIGLGGCGANGSATLSKPGLWKRVNAASVALFRRVLAELTAGLVAGDARPVCDALPTVHRIVVEDSSLLSMADRLLKWFPATGNGSIERAGVRFQFAVDLVTGAPVRMGLTPYNRNDQAAAADILPFLRTGDLLLRDLGYLDHSVLERIVEKGAHFLSRHHTRRVVVHASGPEKGQRIDLTAYLSEHCPVPGEVAELDVSIGTGQKGSPRLHCRMVARRTLPQVAEKRRRRIRRDEKRLGRTRSAEHKRLQDWDILITDLPVEEATAETLFEIYPLRWRVETMFKAFKSSARLREVAGHASNRHHVETMILAWMCLAALAARTGAFALGSRTGPEGRFAPRCVSLLKSIPKVFELLKVGLILSLAGDIAGAWQRIVDQSEYHDRYEKRKKRRDTPKKMADVFSGPPPKALNNSIKTTMINQRS